VNATKILVVEDEPAIAEPMARALARAGYEPLTAGTARRALELVSSAEPDLVLLDLTLPDADGRDLCRELRRAHDTPVIMVTARDSETDRIVGLEIGADDYVVKPFSMGELIARIRAVLRRAAGSPDAPAGPVEVGALRLDPEARRAWLDGSELELSRREFDLLARLMRDAGRVVTRETLIDEVWDRNWFGTTKTLDVHIGWLRRKLGDDPQAPRYIHTVRGVGFRFSAHDEAS
jgi:two-component system, OmpR family, response regulator RegX3